MHFKAMEEAVLSHNRADSRKRRNHGISMRRCFLFCKFADMKAPTMYHGTDARILRMSQEEIGAFKKDILTVLDLVWPFYEPYSSEHQHMEYNRKVKGYVPVLDAEVLKGSLEYDKDSTLYSNIILGITINKNRLNSRKQWQYEGLYLSYSEWLAWNYARRAACFGELGMLAYSFIKGAKKIQFNGWNPDDKVQKAIDRIKCFGEDKAEPVVVVLEYLDMKHIRGEGGQKLKEGYFSRVFLYTGKISLAGRPLWTERKEDFDSVALEYRNGELVKAY